jgi:hypothetical protein
LTQTGEEEAPSITIPSHPAYFNSPLKRPPKLLLENNPVGYAWGPTPHISVRPLIEGTIVPDIGEVMMQRTFLAS